ncbi:MAG: polysaccharide deacetylase family protein [Micrococcales bacterium]|nr:polysaccharide deacetylase family protein [Micrococcales bacterium]
MPSLRSALAAAGIAGLAAGLALGPSVLEVARAADRVPVLSRVTTQPAISNPSPDPTTSPTTLPTPSASATSSSRGGRTGTPRTRLPATARVTPAPPETENGRPVVYLTFDDGPDPTWTPQVLALLAEYRAEATFFMIGEEVARFPSVARQVRTAGHAVGNHTYTHPWLTKLTSAGARSELARTDALLGPTRCMRPPGGFVDARISALAADADKTIELWELDTKDWAHPGVPVVVAGATKTVHAGSVVLMHDGGGDRTQSVAALTQILPALTAGGFVLRSLPACR